MTTPPVTRGNPLIRISLSLAALGLALFVVMKYGKAPKKVPAVPAFRSRTPSSEGSQSFAWIPQYPGANITDIHTRETEAVLSYGFEFQSADASTDVVNYFERGLRRAGFTVVTKSPGGGENNIHGESPDGNRRIDVGVDKVPAGTVVTITAEER